LGVSSDELLK